MDGRRAERPIRTAERRVIYKSCVAVQPGCRDQVVVNSREKSQRLQVVTSQLTNHVSALEVRGIPMSAHRFPHAAPSDDASVTSQQPPAQLANEPAALPPGPPGSPPERSGALPVTRSLSWLSTALAIVLIVEIAGLSVYAWNVFRRETQPERLADRAERALEENYPELRSQMVHQVSQQAPVLAAQVSDRLLEATPSARLELENISLKYLERGLDDAAELSADEFREWLRQNHNAIEDAFIQIEQAPNDARLLVLDTEASLEEQLGLDLRDQAKLTLEVYRMLNDKLERLADPNVELSHQERLERRTIRLLRALGQ